jgi:8-oxo-dGTP diphosphatase
METSRPAIVVSGLVQRGDTVLLVRRRNAPNAGRWALPGGRVEFGERLEAAVIREIGEETGIVAADPRRIDMLEIIDRIGTGTVTAHFILIVFQCRYVGGDVAAGDDASDALWAAPADIARLDLTDSTRRLVERTGGIA